ncbi:MAG: phage tail protein [Spirochaetes bacterium]|nr:phage tail protein [Spirochaetota bacterium]
MPEYYPSMKTNFKVEIDGTDYANFISVSGLVSSCEVTEDVGGLDKTGRKIAGKVKYDTVTLTRNCDPRSTVLKDWWKTVEKGSAEKRNVSVVFIDHTTGEELSRRNLMNCIPCSYYLSDLNSMDNTPLQESITIAFDDANWD